MTIHENLRTYENELKTIKGGSASTTPLIKFNKYDSSKTKKSDRRGRM